MTRQTVRPWVRPEEPQVQKLEARPTWEARPSVERLLLLLVVSVGLGTLLHWWVGMDKATTVAAAVALFLVTWLVELVFSTGFLHKREEQRTEQLRIRGAMMEAIAVNEAQEERLDFLWEEIQRLGIRFDAMDAIRIHEGSNMRVIPKQDALDLQLKAWITGTIFDKMGVVVGAHPNGQLKKAMPFKQRDGDEGAGYRRLTALGLVSKRGDNYFWIGPTTLALTLERMSKGASVGGEE